MRTGLAAYGLAANFENLLLIGVANSNGTGNDAANAITGNDGHNRLLGGKGDDTLAGSAGNDTLEGGTGADRYLGGAGNDTYEVGIGDTVVEVAGEGTDTVRTRLAEHTLSEHVENLELLGSSYRGVGNDEHNLIIGNSADNYLLGGLYGKDTLVGGDGNDVLDGGNSGDDSLVGASGNDTIRGAGTLVGGGGDDFYFAGTFKTTVVELAGEGVDTVQTGSDGYVLAANLENLKFEDNNPSLRSGYGNDANNLLTGNKYNNILGGKAGADTMSGFGGRDTYYVDDPGDVVISGDSDSIVLAHLPTYTIPDSVRYLGLTGTFDHFATGTARSEGIGADAGNNVFFGAGGNDTLGGGGTNELYGEEGNDSLQGYEGNDTLIGGLGRDTLQGGLGDNVFVFETAQDSPATAGSWDVIDFFFDSGSDKIDLSAIEVFTTFIGSDPFSSTDATGQVRYQTGGGLMVFGSTDADADPEFAIKLDVNGLTSLSAEDFIF